jgi:Na+-translocating ferredoxin:NAD+ oxidoreductase RnfG subunit
MRTLHHGRWVPVAAVLVAAPAHATQYLTMEQAQRALFPEADAFAVVPLGQAPVRAWAATKAGRLLGHLMVDEVVGKHELITYGVGIGTDGVVRGVEILDYRETRGGEVRDPRWRAQFVGTRQGSPLRLGEDVQNISGATLSCRHITEGVRRLLALHAVALKQP